MPVPVVTRRLEWLPATFRTAEAELAGLWRRELNRLRDEGRLLERSRGVYRKVDAAETAHLDLLGVAHRPRIADAGRTERSVGPRELSCSGW